MFVSCPCRVRVVFCVVFVSCFVLFYVSCSCRVLCCVRVVFCVVLVSCSCHVRVLLVA